MDEIIDFVIITALDKEREAVLSYIPDLEMIVNKNRVYYKGKLYDESKQNHINLVVLSLPNMGNANAAIATTQAIGVWNPRYIILVGIAGGFKKDHLHLGDIVVGEQIVYYELGKKHVTHDAPRYQVLSSSMELLNFAHNRNTDWIHEIRYEAPTLKSFYPQVHFGVIISGEKVVSTEKFGEDLLKIWPKAEAVEMEAYGTALASYQAENRPGFLFVKSICDWADSEKNDKWQFYSAYAAAAYTINLLRSLIGSAFDLKHNRKQAEKVDKKVLSGKVKICMCKRLLDDWRDLADYFEIPMHKRASFVPGRECQGIWEWLDQRGKLEELLEALSYIDRKDLLECMEADD